MSRTQAANVMPPTLSSDREMAIPLNTRRGPVEHDSMRLSELIVEVEDEVFRIPFQTFSDSPEFRSLLNKAEPGTGVDNRLRLEGVNKTDFLNFLRYVDPRHFRVSTIQDAGTLLPGHCESVLKLSTKWNLANTRASVIQCFPLVSDVEKIVLARKYHITKWLVPALNAYLRRNTAIIISDVGDLGTEYILKIVHLMETVPRSYVTTDDYCGYLVKPTTEIKNRPKYDFRSLLRSIFAEEIYDAYEEPQERADNLEIGDFYLIELFILVEDCLFKSYRQYFEASPVFCEMFALPVPEGQLPDGHSKSRPLHIQGVEKDDFVHFLKIINARTEQDKYFEFSGWISILKLSTMWFFTTIRQLAIKQLESHGMTPAQKINLARLYRIEEWLLPALNAYTQQQEPISARDVDLLSWSYVLKIIDARECTRNLRVSCHRSILGCNKWRHHVRLGPANETRSNHDFTYAIQQAFRDEIREIQIKEDIFEPSHRRQSSIRRWLPS